ncbi:phenylacetic acid degradation operon negative regulatory protein PaaX [Exilibacterium tricleocarpae]|uniref:Phenylacetic acid degradation operon negative regulatory protein PaaX n=1 Tax=Exilibacterium tricleocarpae TaxID=2591008 RepID=A0A545SNJ2_9GAMM|nr:phenylacetic acid degradation operon negative regulatory protein PaaX [Exilibacterium tricleocarpae]TQV66524.1 phenylacetic acid degradation operon negative regulatory protein PaaX [Exilibacterium tricleocarpae]
MSALSSVNDLLQQFCRRKPMRGGSLIVTLFGDSISQHGNQVWLGDVIRVLEPFGLNQRLVRTSVYRLIQEGWLQAEQVGRRSYYRFSDFGLRHYQRAARRIYGLQSETWDNQWTLVMPAQLADEQREALRKELLWLGYGALVPGVLAYPRGEHEALAETLGELGVADKVIVMRACTDEICVAGTVRRQAYNCWRLNELEARYRDFLNQFRPLLESLATAPLADEQCFQLRTLLIHEYRRILLKDTELPVELLPEDWAGAAAQGLTAELYRLVHRGALNFIERELQHVGGTLPPPQQEYFDRFGGLG